MQKVQLKKSRVYFLILQLTKSQRWIEMSTPGQRKVNGSFDSVAQTLSCLSNPFFGLPSNSNLTPFLIVCFWIYLQAALAFTLALDISLVLAHAGFWPRLATYFPTVYGLGFVGSGRTGL